MVTQLSPYGSNYFFKFSLTLFLYQYKQIKEKIMNSESTMFKGLLKGISQLIELKYNKKVSSIIPENGSGRTFIVMFEKETEFTFIRLN